MAEWQNCLDEGLTWLHFVATKINAPFLKQRNMKMKYLDKAVKYNPERWQSYRAFIKCILPKPIKNP
jgi:hypothetical protein